MPFSLTVKPILFASLFVLSSVTLTNMWKGNAASLSFFTVAAYLSPSRAQCSTGSLPVDLAWYPPNASAVNNITTVINGTGIYGFQFDAVTPSTMPYHTYNWCNMPHVRRQEYMVPPPEYKLEYVEVVSHFRSPTRIATNGLRSNAITSAHLTQITLSHERRTRGIAMKSLSCFTASQNRTPSQHRSLGQSTRLHPTLSPLPASMALVNFRRSQGKV